MRARLLVVAARHLGVFDSGSLRLVRSTAIKPAPASPSAATISPDGRTIVIGSQTGSVSFIDAYSGRARPQTGEHSGSVAAVLYADDRSVVTVGDDDKVIVWDPQTASAVKVLTAQAGPIQEAAVSPDATTLYTASNDGTSLAWDLVGDRQFGRSSRLGTGLGCCDPLSPIAPAAALSPDGSRFAAPIGPSTIGLFSTTTLQRQSSFTIHPHTDPVTALAWSPSGHELAIAGHAGLMQLWRVDGSPRLMRSLVGLQSAVPGMPEAIQGVAFSPEGGLLAASDYNESPAVGSMAGVPVARLAIWRVDTGRLTGPLRDLGTGFGTSGTDSLGFSRDGKALAVSLLGLQQPLPGCVLVLDVAADQTRRTLCTDQPDSSVAFAPDGTLAIGTDVGTVELWNPTTGHQIATPIAVASSAVASIAFDPTGQRFATAGYQDGAVKLWFTSTLQQEGPAFTTEQGATSAAEFEPGGSSLLGVDDRGNAFSWPTSLAAWEQRACTVAGRNLTRQEWTRFVTGRAYTRVCR